MELYFPIPLNDIASVACFTAKERQALRDFVQDYEDKNNNYEEEDVEEKIIYRASYIKGNMPFKFKYDGKVVRFRIGDDGYWWKVQDSCNVGLGSIVQEKVDQLKQDWLEKFGAWEKTVNILGTNFTIKKTRNNVCRVWKDAGLGNMMGSGKDMHKSAIRGAGDILYACVDALDDPNVPGNE